MARAGLPMQEEYREKIRRSQCLSTLIRVANGEIEVSKERLDACKYLTNKMLPDLKAIEHTGDAGGPLTVQVVRYSDDG